MGMKTLPQPPYSPDFAACDFSLFPKMNENLRDFCFEDTEKIKEAVTNVLDAATSLNDFHGTFTKWLEHYNNKYIEYRGSYLERD